MHLSQTRGLIYRSIDKKQRKQRNEVEFDQNGSSPAAISKFNYWRVHLDVADIIK